MGSSTQGNRPRESICLIVRIPQVSLTTLHSTLHNQNQLKQNICQYNELVLGDGIENIKDKKKAGY